MSTKITACCPHCGSAMFAQVATLTSIMQTEKGIAFKPDTAPMVETGTSFFCLNCSTVCKRKELERNIEEQKNEKRHPGISPKFKPIDTADGQPPIDSKTDDDTNRLDIPATPVPKTRGRKKTVVDPPKED